MILTVRGDAYLALKNKAKARSYYAEALAKLANQPAGRALVQMKYDDLA